MRRYLLLSLAFLYGLYLWISSLNPPLNQQSRQIPLTPSQKLATQIYLPNTPFPFPAILFCHGVNSSKNTFTPLAQELAHRGIATIVFDFGGSGQSYRRSSSQEANLIDAKTILEWMRRQSQFDRQHLGIIGHSMGGTTAIEIAKANPDIKTTILLGIAGEASPSTPTNLMLGSGAYEELNPVSEMQALSADIAGQPIAPGQIVGQFSQNSARQLVISSTADHAIAPFDPQLHQAVIRWLEQSFNMPPKHLPLTSQRQILGMGLTIFGAIGFAFKLYTGLLSRLSPGLIGSLSLGLFLALVWGNETLSSIAMWGLLVLCSGNYYHRNLATARSTFKQLWLYAGLIFLLFLLAVVINAIVTGSLFVFPQAIWDIPVLAKNLVLGLAYDRFHLWRCNLMTMPGNIVLASLLMIETVKPGLMLQHLRQLASWILRLIRQPISGKIHTVSRKNLVVIFLLLGILTTILYQQYQSGILNWEAGSFALRLVGVFLILPGIIGLLIMRSQLFQRLEQKLGGGSAGCVLLFLVFGIR